MARTDAAAGEGVPAAIARAQAYVKAGADMIFAEALTTLEEYQQFTTALPVPVLANITEFGKTPLFTVEELRSAGIAMAPSIRPAFRAMSAAAAEVYATIRRDGTQQAATGKMQISRRTLRRPRLSRLRAETRPALPGWKTLSRSRNPSRFPAWPQATPPSAQSATPATTCTTRGYDIGELARGATFEEVAHLLIHERLPTTAELSGYLRHFQSLRGAAHAAYVRSSSRFLPPRTRWTSTAHRLLRPRHHRAGAPARRRPRCRQRRGRAERLPRTA